jgi:hypothetical protein
MCGGMRYLHFARISTSGASEYKLNGKVVTYQTYNTTLEQHNILVKAKNFLVFQVCNFPPLAALYLFAFAIRVM